MQRITAKWVPGYSTLYFVSLALLVASLPLSKFTMSVFQFATLFFWLWHGVDSSFIHKYNLGGSSNPVSLSRFPAEALQHIFVAFILKLRDFMRNKPAMVIASIMLLHIIGLIYTSDFNYALKDLRTKLPILALPLIIATGPRISTRVFYWILAAYIAAVVGGSIYRLVLFLNLPVADSRAIESHTSHIRYSLNAVFAVFIALFFLLSQGKLNAGLKVLLSATLLWIVAFMLFMNYSTGILIFGFIGFISLLYQIFKIKILAVKALALIGIVAMIILPLLYVISIGKKYLQTPPVEFSKLDKFTPRGNTYYHDTVNFKPKNGNWTGLYICDKELRLAWAERSRFSLDDYNPKQQMNRYTLIRYLASKGLRKDADGVSQLSDADIRNIEQGIDRYNFDRLPGFRAQVEEFITSYQRYVNEDDPNSSSMIQRFEYWRTSLLIIRQNPVLGVGTGDLPDAFDKQYRKMDSLLAPQYRLRSHNQYLSITVGFGIIGLAWFLFAMFYPGIKTRSFNNYFYLIFWIIFMVSMLTEDTIENQEGVTFYALFTALMILGREKPEPSESLFI